MSKHYKIILTLTIFFAALFMLFIQSSSNFEAETSVLARSDIGTVSSKEFIARYQDYLRRTGIDDNMPARRSILSQMVNEKLLLSTITIAITENVEYKNEIISKRDDFLVSGYADKIIKPSITVSEEELRYNYAVESASYYIRQLFTSTYKEAMSAKIALDDGIEFDIVASKLRVPLILESNTDDLGYVKGKELKRNALAMLASLAVNGVTLPIKVPTGYTLLQLLDKKQNPLIAEQSFAEEIGRLTNSLRSENLTKNAKSQIDNYLNSLQLEWDEALLRKFHTYLNEKSGRMIEPVEREELREYGISYSDNIFLNKNVIFTIGEYFEWSNRLSYRKPANVKTIKDLQSYVKGLVARRYLVEESFKNGIDDEKFQSEYAKSAERIKLRLLKQAVIDSSNIADREIKDFYDENYSSYTLPAHIRVREIVVQSGEFARTLIDSINAGYDASELAAKYTLRQSAREFGGDLGFLNVNEFGEFKHEVERAEIGKLLGPFPKGDYHVIFELLDKTESYKPGYEEMKTELRTQYIMDNRNSILGRTYRRLAKEHHSQIYFEKLNSINLVALKQRAAI